MALSEKMVTDARIQALRAVLLEVLVKLHRDDPKFALDLESLLHMRLEIARPQEGAALELYAEVQRQALDLVREARETDEQSIGPAPAPKRDSPP